MLTSRRTTAISLFAAALLLLAACGGSDSPKPAAVESQSSTSSSSSSSSSSAAASGTVEAIAGNGKARVDGDEPGPATSAGLDRPENVAVTSTGDVYIADNDTQRILRVRAGSITAVYTGTSAKGESNTFGVAVAPDDTVWFSNGAGVFKMAGTTATQVLSSSNQVQGAPFGLTFDKAGNLYIAEAGGNRVRKYDTSGTVSLIAGTGEAGPQAGGVGDGGPASAAQLGRPVAVAVDSAGNVYVAENATRRIRKITADGTITTFAGGGTTDIATAADGIAATAIKFNTVDSVAVDAAGRVYVADHQQQVIVRFGPDAKLVHVAGSATGSSGDGQRPLATKLESPSGMTFDREGTLYFVDGLRVRRIKGIASA